MDTRDKYNRFPADQHLRNHGYRIVSRPNEGEATWMNVAGVVVKESEALKHIAEFRERCKKGGLE